MKMTEHRFTPGPWVPVELKLGIRGRSFWVAISADGRLKETEANARLIAAAPELLAVCERYADFIRTSVKADDLEMHPYLPELEALIERASS
jgi:DUF1680 family protein